MLYVSEIFTSLQGEASFAGRACSFIRLSGCNLNCTWCDTPYARQGGDPWRLEALLEKVRGGPELVSITGGEPLLQRETPQLARALLEEGRRVLVETNGSLPIDVLERRVNRLVDLKPPSSGEVEKNHWPNLKLLRETDEIKIVVADRGDFLWAKELLEQHPVLSKVTVNLTPAYSLFSARELADLIVSEKLPVRLNLQLHRILWPEAEKGR